MVLLQLTSLLGYVKGNQSIRYIGKLTLASKREGKGGFGERLRDTVGDTSRAVQDRERRRIEEEKYIEKESGKWERGWIWLGRRTGRK